MVMYSRMIMHGPDLRCSYICSTKELLFASDYLDTHTQLETKAWKHAASLHGWHLIQGMFMNDEFERAKEVYLEAIGVSADCLEAIYNLGLVNMHIGNLFAKKISVFYGHWDTKNGYKRAGGWAMPLWQASIRRPCWPLTSCILSPMWIATWRFSLRFFHWCTAALNMLFVHVYIIHVFLICIYISYIVYECKPKEEQVLWQGVGSIFVCWRFHFNIIYVHSNRIRCHAARRSHVATGWYSWEARQSWQGWVRWFRESAAVAGRKSWTDRYMSPKCWSIWSMQWIFLLYTCWCLANSKKCIYRCNNVCIYISIGLYTPNHPLEHLLQCWLPKECGTYDMGHALKEKNVGRMNHTAGMIFWVSLCLHFFLVLPWKHSNIAFMFFLQIQLKDVYLWHFFPIFHQSSLVNSLQRVGFFSEPPQPKPMIFPFGRRMNGFHFWWLHQKVGQQTQARAVSKGE